MSVPVLASLVIFQFLWVWNDLLVALVYLGVTPSALPVSVVLANSTTSRGGDWQFLTAAAFISMVVPIVIFLSLQRYFVRGITGGAVKG
jgi:alpha-glucoside transport system permease protein